MHLKFLSDKLRSEKVKAESMVNSESASEMTVDIDLQKYSGDLAEINEDLRTIHALRDEERRLRGEIDATQKRLQKAKKTKKNLIIIAIIAIVVAIGVATTVIVIHKQEQSLQTEMGIHVNPFAVEELEMK